jgi:hypothetical protein
MFHSRHLDGVAAFSPSVGALRSAKDELNGIQPTAVLHDGDERQIVKRKLFAIEQIAEMNIACLVRLEGRFSLDQLRAALARVQGKHPVLRALIRKEEHGLYYEQNSAPSSPRTSLSFVSSGCSRNGRANCCLRPHTASAI